MINHKHLLLPKWKNKNKNKKDLSLRARILQDLNIYDDAKAFQKSDRKSIKRKIILKKLQNNYKAFGNMFSLKSIST